MTTTFQIEALENVIAPGKGSAAYKVGHAIGRAISAAVSISDWF